VSWATQTPGAFAVEQAKLATAAAMMKQTSMRDVFFIQSSLVFPTNAYRSSEFYLLNSIRAAL